MVLRCPPRSAAYGYLNRQVYLVKSSGQFLTNRNSSTNKFALNWLAAPRCNDNIIIGVHQRGAETFLSLDTYLSPRWGLVTNTSCWGGGGQRALPEISQITGPISKFQTPFDSPVHELPLQDQKFDPEVTDDVTGQVK